MLNLFIQNYQMGKAKITALNVRNYLEKRYDTKLMKVYLVQHAKPKTKKEDPDRI